MISDFGTIFGKVLKNISDYNNGTLFFVIFIIAIIALWIVEKDKNIKICLVYLSVILAAIFICPLYAWIGMKIDEDIYYRVFWALPIGVVCVYAVVKLMIRLKKKVLKVLCFLAAVAVIMLNGKMVYTNTIHFKSVNAYHLPQVVINVADALRLDNYKAIAVLPAELLPFIRQYSGDTLTPYGRNIMELSWRKWGFKSELYDAMENDPDKYIASEVARCARNEYCVFVVLSSAKQIEGSMEENNYFLLNFVDGYYIYMDYNYYWVLKEQNLLDPDVIAIGG